MEMTPEELALIQSALGETPIVDNDPMTEIPPAPEVTPTPVPTPAPVATKAPVRNFTDDELKSIDAALAPAPVSTPPSTTPLPEQEHLAGTGEEYSLPLMQVGVSLDEEKRFARELAAEDARRQKVLAQIHGKENGPVYWHGQIDDPIAGWVGGMGMTIGNLLTKTSTMPSKALYEVQAARSTNPNDRPLSLERGLASTVNLVKSLWPGGESPAEAAKKYTWFDEENARKKMDRIYNTPILDQYGNVNYESLQYSNLPRYMQNELSVLWAVQQTGLANKESFRKVLASRGGVLSSDSNAEAGAKRALQIVDNAAFNIPTYLFNRATIGTRMDELFPAKKEKPTEVVQGIGAQTALRVRPNVQPPYQSPEGDWYVNTRDGTPVKIEDYDPTANVGERMRKSQDAILHYVTKTLEYQAQETLTQIVDPTMLMGTGAIKGAVKGAAKMAGIEAGGAIARSVGMLSPYVENSGLLAGAARIGIQAPKAVRLPQVSEAILNIVRSDTVKGKTFRFVDRTLTNTALMSALSATGAPEGDKTTAAVTGGLLALGMSPLYVMQTRAPVTATWNAENKNFIREVFNNPDPTKLSDFSKRQVAKDMKARGYTDYNEYLGLLRSPQMVQELADEATKHITDSNITPAMAMEASDRLAGDAKFQASCDDFSQVADNTGHSQYGVNIKYAIGRVAREAEQYAVELESKAQDVKLPNGSASALPLTDTARHISGVLKSLFVNLPAEVVNTQAAFKAWIDGEISGNHLPTIDSRFYLNRETAEAIKAQVDAIDLKEIYRPMAHMAIITNAAMREASPVAKSFSMSDIYRSYRDLQDHFASLNSSELSDMFHDLVIGEYMTKGEGPMHKMVRRADKAEMNELSPAAASKVLVSDLREAYRDLPAKVANEADLRRQARVEKDPNKKIFFTKMADEIRDDINDTRKSTMLYQMYKFATDTQRDVVSGRGAIAKAKAQLLEADAMGSLSRYIKEQTLDVHGAQREIELLQQESRINAIQDKTELTDMAASLRARGEILKVNHEKVIGDALITLKYDPAFRKSGMDLKTAGDILMGRGTKASFTKDLGEDAVKAIENVRSRKRSIRENKERLITVLTAATTLDDRLQKMGPDIDRLEQGHIDTDYNYPAAAEWFDSEIALASAFRVDATDFYKNVKREILDHLNRRMIDPVSGLTVPQNIPTNLLTALRMLGDETWVQQLVGDEAWTTAMRGKAGKNNFRIYSNAVNNLADNLAVLSARSNVAEEAAKAIQIAIDNPLATSLPDLLKAQQQLEGAVFTDALLKDAAKKDGYFAKLEKLIYKNTNGLVTKTDWNLIRELAKDSVIGKGYRYAAEIVGEEMPWIITYKQDVANMMQKLIGVSVHDVDRVMSETAKFLHGTGQLVSPTDFDVKVVAGFFLSTVDSASSLKPRTMQLLAMANAWKERTKNMAEGFQFLDQIAISLDRQTGAGVHRDLMRLFDAGNKASAEGETFIRPMLQELSKIKYGDVKYVDHQRPSSPIRKLLTRSTVATAGHDSLKTAFIDFVKSGYHDGVPEIISSDIKSANAPIEVKPHSVMTATDHLVVNGELTAFGKVYEEWISRPDKMKASDMADVVLARYDTKGKEAEASALHGFLTRRLEWYGSVTPNEFKVFKDALTTIQRYDRIGLEKVNQMNQLTNASEKTSYPDINYEPWRLDADVATTDAKIVNTSLLGSFADNDRMMGQRYSTTPEAQITKATLSGIDTDSVINSPEDLVMNRHTRLVNEVYSRKARASLSRKAQLLEHMGYSEQAAIVKDNILNSGIQNMVSLNQLSRWISTSDNKLVSTLGIILRQISNPFVVLVNPRAMVIDQPLQQAVLQISNKPGLRTFASATNVIQRYWRDAAPRWFTGFAQALASNTEKINVETNGRSLRIGDKYVNALEDIYENVTKRSDPYVQAVLAETKRGGDAKIKSLSRFMATAPLTLEGSANRALFAIKEAGENRGARALLPQVGAIWEIAMNKFKKEGEVGLHRYLTEFMTGPMANPRLQSQLVDLVKSGDDAQALKVFGTYYINQNIGTWNHQNIPKNIRIAAHIVPGADTFYTASALGIHRTLMSVLNMNDLSPHAKAMAVISVLSTLGIAGGLAALQEETGIQWFDRISPLGVVGSAVSFCFKHQFDANTLRTALKKIGTRVEIRSGQVQAVATRQLQTLLAYLASLIPSNDVVNGVNSKPDESDTAMNRFLAAVLDTTLASPAAGLFLHTPREMITNIHDTLQGVDGDPIREGLATSTFAESDVVALEAALYASRNEADKLERKKLYYEAVEGEPITTSVEDVSLSLLRAFANVSLAAQEEIWKSYGYASFRIPFKPPQPDTSILSRGVRASDPFAKLFYDTTRKAIERYEAQRAKNEETITGYRQPVNTEQAAPTPQPEGQ